MKSAQRELRVERATRPSRRTTCPPERRRCVPHAERSSRDAAAFPFRRAGRLAGQAGRLFHPELLVARLERPKLWKSAPPGRGRQHLRRVCCPKFWLALALLCVSAFAARAQETVIVPYDPARPLSQQQPDQLYLPYERLLELWQKAKQNRTAPVPVRAPHAFALTSARYDGRIEEKVIRFSGVLDVTTYNEDWVKVPLAFRGVRLSGLRVDGEPAALTGEELLIEKPGRHRIEVELELARQPGATHWKWGVPRTVATLISVALPRAEMRATITPGSGSVERAEGEGKVTTAAVGDAGEVELTLETAAVAARLTEPAVAVITTEIFVAPPLERTRATTTFSFPSAQQDRFTVHLDKTLALVELDAADVKTWKLVAGPQRQSLEILLNAPARDTFTVAITAERPLPELPADMKAPAFSAIATRVEAGPALLAATRADVAPKPGAGLRQVAWEAAAPEGFRLVAAYAGAGELGYRVALAAPEREARIDYVYQVNRRKIELIASLQLSAKDEKLFDVAVTLPPDFQVQTVESARLQDWWREGDQLHVRFKGDAPGKTSLVLHLVRLYPTAPTELEVRPLALAGFQKVTGEAVIAGHKGVEVKMTPNAEAKEIAAAEAAKDFQILPPLERKRGFSFKTQGFSAQVAITALPAKLSALWVMHAQAHTGWVALSTKARLTLRQGSIDRATFTLPAPLPEARVSGGEVRETRSRVEGERRIYEVQFQDDVHESVDFTMDLDLPSPGTLALPAIGFPDAPLVSGYVLADNASEDEMKLDSSGVDPAAESEIPWLPSLTKSAGIFRVQAAWSVAVSVERLEKAASRTAFCAWAEITTALRRDGTEWHRATWRLQNRSLQFLPVKLPIGAELMSARVAGQSVRADAGKVSEQEVVLIPLIKTRPGDLSYDVDVVYRSRRGELGWLARRQLDDPELIGITVERTFWNLWLPEDRDLQHATGNMEPVLEELAKAEKLEEQIAELTDLNSLISSGTANAEIAENAKFNFRKLNKDVENLVVGQIRDHRFAEVKGLKKGAVAEQNAAVQEKRRTLSEKLAVQGQLFSSNEKATPVVPPQSWASQPGAVRTYSSSRGRQSRSETAAPQPAEQPQQAQQLQQPQQAAGLERWYANRSYAAKGKDDLAPIPVPEDGTNLLLNDNIVLQQRAEAPAEAEVPQSKQEAAGAMAGEKSNLKPADQEIAVAQQQFTQGRFRLDNNVPAPSTAPAKPQREKVLSTARGNRAQIDQLARAEPQQPPAATAPTAPQMPSEPARPQPATTPEPPAESPAESAPGGVAGAAAASPAPASDTRLPGSEQEGVILGGSPRDAQQTLQPAGRISLAVDFPTEGQVYHFKKVKAHAALEVAVIAPESLVRWKYAAAAVVLGVGLWLLGRRATRERPSHRATVAAMP